MTSLFAKISKQKQNRFLDLGGVLKNTYWEKSWKILVGRSHLEYLLRRSHWYFLVENLGGYQGLDIAHRFKVNQDKISCVIFYALSCLLLTLTSICCTLSLVSEALRTYIFLTNFKKIVFTRHNSKPHFLCHFCIYQWVSELVSRVSNILTCERVNIHAGQWQPRATTDQSCLQGAIL